MTYFIYLLFEIEIWSICNVVHCNVYSVYNVYNVYSVHSAMCTMVYSKVI